MSRDYSPAELATQQLHNFKDTWVHLWIFGKHRTNHAPVLPAAKLLNIPRDSRQRTVGRPIEFHPKNGAHILSPKRSLGTVPSDGVSSGVAINEANTSESRTIKVGRKGYPQRDANGDRIRIVDPVQTAMLKPLTGKDTIIDQPEQVLRSIPAGPKDWVHHGGWPERPAWDDRSACWVADDGSIVSVWQWQPRLDWVVVPHEWYRQWENHAATWGRFNSRGELVEGSGGSTANGDPWACTTLTPDLIGGEPRLLSLFAPIYSKFKRPIDDQPLVQVDGLLEQPEDQWGLACGDVLIWREDSELIKWLRSLGPVNQYIADCMTQCGLLVNDQAGSKRPVERDGNGVVITESLDPKAPALRVQACRDWAETDIGEFQFSLEEAHLAEQQHVEFRVEGDPHTEFPTDSEPVPDPRLALVRTAGATFGDVLTDLGLPNGPTNTLHSLNDQTVSEAIRLIEQQGGQ